jgi:two-component system, OmpR family, alkaline phosphatase synthesis response regulator PhoP
MPRILIAEDNPDLAWGLKLNLEGEGYEVDVATTGGAALAGLRSATPDLLILDVMLPELDGFQVLAALREEGYDLPVLILSARSDEAERVLGLRLGADDYVTKPFSLLELIYRVKALLRRAAPLQRAEAAVLKAGDLLIDHARRRVLRSGLPVQLTAREFDLLWALVRRGGETASREDLLREVWGYRAPVESRAVDFHVVALRRKLETNPSGPRYVRTVRRQGYRFEVDG